MKNETDRFVPLFEEFMSIYKLVNRSKIVDALRGELKTAQAIEMYQLSDGERATREVVAAMKNKCSHVTVANTWKKWALIGIAVPTEKQGRYRAAFNLEEYGITDVVENEG